MITKSKALTRAITNSVVLVIFFIFSSQFFATFWLWILPVGFFIVLFFTVAIIKNLLFWIRNKAADQPAWLPLLIQIFAILAVCLIPSHNRSKTDHKFTVDLGSYKPNGCPVKLYCEAYCVFGMGALGSDLYSDYLTDSLNFRLYTGTYDEETERITYKCSGDSVYIEKRVNTSSMPRWNWPKLEERKVYSLADLRKRHTSD